MNLIKMEEISYKKLRKYILAFMILGMICVLPLSSTNVRGWSASLNFSPSRVEVGEGVSFECVVRNTGNQRMKVSAVEVSFGWNQDRSYRLDDTNSEDIIQPGSSRTFTRYISVPSGGILTDYSHDVEITITAYDPGLWGEWAISPNTRRYTTSIYVSEESESSSDSTSESTPGFTFIGVTSAVTVATLITIWKKKHR